MSTYITVHGARQLADELRRLVEIERPKVVTEVADAAAQGDRSENAEYIYGKKRLREIDRRLRFLQKRLDDCTVVALDEVPADTERIYFGAVVTIEDEDGEQKRYQLVGPDEAQPALGLLSYQSPLGKVLLRRKVGDVVQFRRPAGEVDLEVVDVQYCLWLPNESSRGAGS